MSEASVYQQLRSHLAYLRLTAISEVVTAELERAQQEQLSHTTLLERLFAIEVQATEARRQAARLRFAAFPATWTLEDFDFSAQPKLDRKLVEELATLRFVAEATNVLLIGPPGVARPTWRSPWASGRWRPGSGCTPPRPPTWRPAVIGRHSPGAGTW